MPRLLVLLPAVCLVAGLFASPVSADAAPAPVEQAAEAAGTTVLTEPLTVDVGHGTATLTWSGTSGASGYLVGRDGVDSTGYGAWSTVDPSSARSRTFTQLVDGRPYTLFVQAQPGGAKQTIRITGGVATPAPGPTAPPVTAVVGNGTATLTWSGTSGASGYLVGRDGVDSTGYGAWSTVDPSSARKRTFTQLVNGRTYTLSVQAQPSGDKQTIRVTPHVSPTPTPTPTPTPKPTPTPTPTPKPTPTPGTTDSSPGWLSGASSSQAADGSYGTWRGSPVEIVGFWVNDPALYPIGPKISGCGDCGAVKDFAGPIDMGVAPPSWSSWANEANGEHDAFWTAVFRNAKALRAGKGTTYIRPWYEFNGNWMPYSVRPGEEAAFKQAYLRINQIQDREFPASKLMLGVSASGPVSVAGTWPSAGVDVLNIDFYNNWPFCTTTVCFDDKIENGGGASSLSDLRRLAQSKGVPVAIGEWSNQGERTSEGSGGGGESPQFMRDWKSWLTANAGTGPGQVLYEVQFNLWSGQFELFTAAKQTTSVQPLTAEEYRRLW